MAYEGSIYEKEKIIYEMYTQLNRKFNRQNPKEMRSAKLKLSWNRNKKKIAKVICFATSAIQKETSWLIDVEKEEWKIVFDNSVTNSNVWTLFNIQME